MRIGERVIRKEDQMDIPLAMVADYANVTKEGKLNIMGIFSRVIAPAVPFQLPTMQVVFVLRYAPPERGIKNNLKISLVDADGVTLLELGTDFEIPVHGPPSGEMNQILGLNGLTFPRHGDYAFHVLINGDSKAQVSFSVVPPEDPAMSGAQGV
jgi:hypothetical protein